MNRTDYIRLAAAFLLPHTKRGDDKWDLDAAIGYAQELWRRTGGAEVDDKTAGTPRELGYWYRELSKDAQQKGWFDQFWEAFNHKQGRDGAAMRWVQIAPSADLAKTIIDAARLDAQKERPRDAVRKMAQGWLSEARWEDYDTRPKSQRQAAPEVQRAHQLNELRGLETLYRHSESQDLRAKIDRLRADLRLPAFDPTELPKRPPRDRPSALGELI